MQIYNSNNSTFAYLAPNERDELWGMTVDTTGKYIIEPGCDSYPPSVGHPSNYYFDVGKGRIMNNFLILYITSGKGRFRCHKDDEPVEIKAGSVIFIPPYKWHSYCPDKEAGWKEYWIGFSGPAIEQKLANGILYDECVVHNIGLQEHIIDKFEEAINLATSELIDYQFVLASIAESILAYILHYSRNDLQNSMTIEKINTAKGIIRENIDNMITPEMISDMLNVSYSWFRKMFKQYTGVSPAQYITQIKLQKAKMLLLNTNKTIKEIAFELHYEDTAYFSTTFKKHVGQPPREYKEQYRRTIAEQ